MIRKLLTRRILLTAMIFIVTMLVSLMANVSANAEYKKTDIKLETANTNDVFRTQMTDLVLKASDIMTCIPCKLSYTMIPEGFL